jgi:hypothetical protein
MTNIYDSKEDSEYKERGRFRAHTNSVYYSKDRLIN